MNRNQKLLPLDAYKERIEVGVKYRLQRRQFADVNVVCPRLDLRVDAPGCIAARQLELRDYLFLCHATL